VPPDQHHTARGTIAVIHGCMFAGKTARLIERLSAARASGRRKHVLDNRYDPARLMTHDGHMFAAIAVAGAVDVEHRARGADVVGIDEAQFFGRGLIRVCRRLTDRGANVIVAGIDHDAWGQPFPPLPALADSCDDVEHLYAPCRICGQPAVFSQRMVPVVDGRMVGGPGEYEPRCGRCFVPLPGPAPTYENLPHYPPPFEEGVRGG